MRNMEETGTTKWEFNPTIIACTPIRAPSMIPTLLDAQVAVTFTASCAKGVPKLVAYKKLTEFEGKQTT